MVFIREYIKEARDKELIFQIDTFKFMNTISDDGADF